MEVYKIRYRKMTVINVKIDSSGSFDTAPIMLGGAAMNLAAILIHLL